MEKLQYVAPEVAVLSLYADAVTTSGGGVTKGVDYFGDYFSDDWRGNNG